MTLRFDLTCFLLIPLWHFDLGLSVVISVARGCNYLRLLSSGLFLSIFKQKNPVINFWADLGAECIALFSSAHYPLHHEGRHIHISIVSAFQCIIITPNRNRKASLSSFLQLASSKTCYMGTKSCWR